MAADTQETDKLTDHPPAGSDTSSPDAPDYKALYEKEKSLHDQERREMREILEAKDVKPTEKMVLAWIRLEAATRAPGSNRVVFEDLTEELLAKQLDLSESTIRAALQALADVHLIERTQTHSESLRMLTRDSPRPPRTRAQRRR